MPFVSPGFDSRLFDDWSTPLAQWIRHLPPEQGILSSSLRWGSFYAKRETEGVMHRSPRFTGVLRAECRKMPKLIKPGLRGGYPGGKAGGMPAGGPRGETTVSCARPRVSASQPCSPLPWPRSSTWRGDFRKPRQKRDDDFKIAFPMHNVWTRIHRIDSCSLSRRNSSNSGLMVKLTIAIC